MAVDVEAAKCSDLNAVNRSPQEVCVCVCVLGGGRAKLTEPDRGAETRAPEI